MPRMPTDSFERFVALGPSRSYAKLAAALGCSKRSVTAKATKENWQARLAGIEEQARAKADNKLAETTAAINDRHLRTLRAVQHKALQALTTSRWFPKKSFVANSRDCSHGTMHLMPLRIRTCPTVAVTLPGSAVEHVSARRSPRRAGADGQRAADSLAVS